MSDVKIGDIEVERPRIELKDVPNICELLLVKTGSKKAVKDENGKTVKTGGITLTFQMRDEREFTHKYSPRFATMLVKALSDLGYETLKPLTEKWHKYEKINITTTTGGTIYPRMIPNEALEEVEKVDILSKPKKK